MKSNMFRTVIKALALTLISLCSIRPAKAQNAAYDANGHYLTGLWAQVDDLWRRALPTECLDVLEKIKIEAAMNDRTMDYYDACKQSFEISRSRDWKSAAKFMERFRREIEASPDIRVKLLYLDEYDPNALKDYVAAHEQELRKSFEPAIRVYLHDEVTSNCIENDYQFALWLSRDYEALAREHSGNGIKTDVVEFYRLKNDYTIPYTQRMEIMLSRKDMDGAASILYTEQVLNESYYSARAGDDALKQAYKECMGAIEKQSSLKGEDKLIFQDYTGLSLLQARFEKGEILSRQRSLESISYVLKNLPDMTVTISRDNRTLAEQHYASGKDFMFIDTLHVDLSSFDDGSYTLKTSDGQSIFFEKNTLSLTIIPTEKGSINRVIDLRTGESVQDFRVHYDKASSLRRVTLLRDGIVRQSQAVGIPQTGREAQAIESEQLKIITGAGVFHPGDTVRFKVVGGVLASQAHAAAKATSNRSLPKGTKVSVSLRRGGEQLASMDLKLNDFGSAEGSFVLPVGEEAAQYYSLHASSGKVSGTQMIKVDNYVLPSFTFAFDPIQGLPKAGQTIAITGKLKSFDGHKVSEARLSVSRGEVSMDAEGKVTITVELENTDYQGVSLSVTDNAGETHEFYKSIMLRPLCTVENISLRDGFLSFTPAVRNSDGIPVDASVSLTIKDGEKLLHSGVFKANTLQRVQLGVESLSLSMTSDNYPLSHYETIVADGAKTLSETIDFIMEKTADGARFGFGSQPMYAEYYLTDARGILVGNVSPVTIDKSHQIEYVSVPQDKQNVTLNVICKDNHWTLPLNQSPEQTAALSVSLASPQYAVRQTVKASITSQPGMECVAVVFDRTLEDIYSARPEPFRHRLIQPLRTKLMSMSADYEANYSLRTVEEESLPFMTPPSTPEAIIRSNFSEVIAFEPFIRTDSRGRAEFTFRTSDRTGSYIVLVFAHDKSLSSAVATTELTVFQPVQLSMSLPSAFVESDRFIPSLNISNSGAKDVRGDLSIKLIDGASAQGKVLAYSTMKNISVKADAASAPRFPAFDVPSCDTLGILISYGEHDAIFLTAPVLPKVRSVINARSKVLLSGTPLPPAPPAGWKAEVLTAREILSADLKAISRGEDDALSLSAAMVAAPSEKVAMLLSKLQTEEGGFAWVQGFGASAMITALVLERLAFADRQAPLPERLHASLLPALRYLDIDQNGAAALPLEQYLYVRGLFAGVDTGVIMGPDFELRKQKYLETPVGLDAQWVIWRRARRAEILLSHGMDASADIASLRQFAVEHQSGGLYFPGAVMPFRGLLESEIYAHAHICRVLSSLKDDASAQEIARGLRVWMTVQRQTQQWSDNPSYIDALAAVMEDETLLDELRIYTESAELLQHFDEVKPDGNGMSISRKWFRILSDGSRTELGPDDVLQVGDKVEAEVVVHSEENRSLVTVSLPYPACLAPAGGLSGYRAGAVRRVLPGQTKYWYETLPEQKTVLHESYHVTTAGTFAALFPELVCNYAPAFRANGHSDTFGSGTH